MTGSRIIILTPGQLGSNPRVVKEANALHAAGHSVHVIATKVVEFVEPRDQAVLSVAPWSSERLAFDSGVLWRRERLLQEAARRVGRLVPIARVASIAHSAFSRQLEVAAVARPADLYVAHYPAALGAAARAAARHSGRFAYDAEDFHLGDLPDAPEHAREKRIIREIEGRYLPRAAYVTAASHMIAEAYAETYGIPLPTTVLNVFPKHNAPGAPTPRGSAKPGPSVYWFSQTIGPGRGLETAIEAIGRALSRPHLYVRGTPAGRYADELRRLAARGGVAERLHLLDPAPPDELERLGSIYDLGFVGELAETKNRQIAIANKLFSYLLGGVPSLASDIPAHRRIAPDLGPAISLFPIGDAMALAAAIDALMLNPLRLAAAREHAWRLGQQKYNWEPEAPRFLECVQTALDG